MRYAYLMRSGIFAIIILTLFAGCSTQSHYRSSVVQYLYPEKKAPVETEAIPLLSLPIKVGIAFVPEASDRIKNLSEKNKIDLMTEISGHFKKYDFVKSIELIPSAYLRPEGSFSNLD